MLSMTPIAARVPALAERNVSVLIWTTTPWTIPSNLAVAFHPELSDEPRLHELFLRDVVSARRPRVDQDAA